MLSSTLERSIDTGKYPTAVRTTILRKISARSVICTTVSSPTDMPELVAETVTEVTTPSAGANEVAANTDNASATTTEKHFRFESFTNATDIFKKKER